MELDRLLVTFRNMKNHHVGKESRMDTRRSLFHRTFHPKVSTSTMLEYRLLLGLMLSAPMPESLMEIFYNDESDLSNAEIPERFTLKNVSFNDGKDKIFFLLEKEYETVFGASLEEFCRQFSSAEAVVKELEKKNQIIMGTVTVQEHPGQQPEKYRVGPY
jgi:hypothetical protein